MGCSASKLSSKKKRLVKESWYAPVVRSASAPINYHGESQEGSCSSESSHNVSLTSSTYGKFSIDKAGLAVNSDNFLYVLEKKLCLTKDDAGDYIVGAADEDTDMEDAPPPSIASSSSPSFSTTYSYEDLGFNRSRLKYSTRLNPVEEVAESEYGEVEVINTWELMEGLDDDVEDDMESSTGSPRLSNNLHNRSVEKSLSFSKVHELDSCFSELAIPEWNTERKNGEHHPSLKEHFLKEHVSQAGSFLTGPGAKSSSSSRSRSPMKTPPKSPMRSPIKSPMRSPLKSPLKNFMRSSSKHLMKSPMITPMRSPLKSPLVGSTSPLFDPALMAAFEKAVESSTLAPNDWMLIDESHDGSTTTSTFSSCNTTWMSSDTSSDPDSPDSGLKIVHKPNYAQCAILKRVVSARRLPTENEYLPSYDLESFEYRCPPKGEHKVVLYFTSLRGVRKTFKDCCRIRQILQGLGVYVDERDIWMHSKFRDELIDLLGNNKIQVPRLFINGRYIGGVDEVVQLHEDGILVRLIRDLPSFGMFMKACDGCNGVRFVPCFTCYGSCKVLDESDKIARCPMCNENGLIMCPLCS